MYASICRKTVHTMLRSVKSTCYITFTAIYDKMSFLRMKVKWNRNLHGQEKQKFFEKKIIFCHVNAIQAI